VYKEDANVYFSKKVYTVYNEVWGKASEAGEFSTIFALKVGLTLQFVRLLLTVSYRKILGEQDVLVAPPIILLGEQLLPCSPGSRVCGTVFHRTSLLPPLSIFCCQSSAGSTVISTEFLWTSGLLCCWSADVELSTETFA